MFFIHFLNLHVTSMCGCINNYGDILVEREEEGVTNSQLFLLKLLDVVILLCSAVVACLFTQVKIQKESEVRLKIIGTRVDATEIVSLLLSTLFIYSKMQL